MTFFQTSLKVGLDELLSSVCMSSRRGASRAREWSASIPKGRKELSLCRYPLMRQDLDPCGQLFTSHWEVFFMDPSS